MKKNTTNSWVHLLIISTILIFSVWIKTANLSVRYGFEWDQADDATKVMTMVWEKKPLLIGPRVASENGFFASPIHYYFLSPFYLATGGHPIAGAYTVIFVSLITVISTYFVGSRLYGRNVGLVAALITASATSLVSWNAMFIAPLSILAFYFCQKLLTSNALFLPASFILSLGATVHLVPASLLAYLGFSQIISSQKAKMGQIIKGLLFLVLALSPLIIFDLRHQALNLNKFLEFLSFNRSSFESHNPWLFLQTFWKSIFITGNINFPNSLLFEKILVLASFLYAVIKQTDNKKRIMNFVWIVLPIILLSKYKGNIPEYYYGCVTALIPIFVSRFLVDNFPLWLTGVFLYLLLLGQVKEVLSKTVPISLTDKLNVVQYIANQREFPVYNVSYDLPLGYNTGYQYLFKYLKKEPTSGPEGHLFTISLTSNEKEKYVYKSGLIGVIQR